MHIYILKIKKTSFQKFSTMTQELGLSAPLASFGSTPADRNAIRVNRKFIRKGTKGTLNRASGLKKCKHDSD